MATHRKTAFTSNPIPQLKACAPRRHVAPWRNQFNLPSEFFHCILRASIDTGANQLGYIFVENAGSSSLPGITPIREFEPIVNAQPLSAFLIITLVFALLQYRIHTISDAASRRTTALEVLRRAESLKLSGSDVGEPNLVAARNEYESALREELQLRTVIPGVRIVAPNDPKRNEEQRAAAKRFLGWDANEFDDGVNIIDDDDGAFGLEQSDSEQVQLPSSAKFVLLGLASILIPLLWTLSTYDPMSPNNGLLF